MSFQDFRTAIRSPNLLRLALHWQEARAARAMPGWNDLKPAAIKRQLSIVFSYTYDAGLDDFHGRIAGDAVHKVFGRQFRGARMSELQSAFEKPRLLDRARRVVGERALFHGIGLVYRQADRDSFGERIILPLASDGAVPDGILGATEYRTRLRLAAEDDGAAEAESWFALG